MTNGMYPFCSALHSIQRAPSWKGLHTLVVKPPNVGKGYAFVMSESHHEVYMFMFVKSQRSVEKNHLKISLIQSPKEICFLKKRKAKWCIVENCEKARVDK